MKWVNTLRRDIVLPLMACVLMGTANANTAEPEPAAVGINGLGFFPWAEKQATASKPGLPFNISKAADGAEVLQGISAPLPDGHGLVDFSELRQPGEYRLRVGEGEPHHFVIGNHIYDDALRMTMEAFYLWRCGGAVRLEHGDNVFEHAACHLQDAKLDAIGWPGEMKDATGGWHDAGDYNKYVVNAGVTVGVMLQAWEQNRSRLEGLKLRIPESGGPLPDYLAELKWELDWLLKTQYPDGSGRVAHKISARTFSGMVMPEEDQSERFFVPWSSAATASFAAMCAKASRVYAEFDQEFADKLLAAARSSDEFLRKNPKNVHSDQSGFSTGEYKTRDWDDRLWASAELWESTGEDQFLRDFESRLREADQYVEIVFDWGDVKNLAVFTYLRSMREGRNSEMLATARATLLDEAREIVGNCQAHPFARTLGNDYWWGCNGAIARQVVVLRTAAEIEKDPAFRQTSLAAIEYLFGRNDYGRSYVTGIGPNPPRSPHDRRSAADGVEAPWPGYLVGGAQQPGGWEDEKRNYSVNEIAINWNAALVYALSCFAEPATGAEP